MQRRTLGKSNLEVSAIGFGCMGLNFQLWPCPKQGSIDLAEIEKTAAKIQIEGAQNPEHLMKSTGR
jgi:aryl-alcohol dehydrogenase-like predicted oxidoreductase